MARASKVGASISMARSWAVNKRVLPAILPQGRERKLMYSCTFGNSAVTQRYVFA